MSEESESSKNQYPAFNKEMIIDINGDSISGYAFVAHGESLKETVILISGYPGNDSNFDIAQAIRRSGKNVVYFNHRGAWGSQGLYSYSNCLEDIRLLIKHLSEAEVSNELRIDTTNFTLLGRSFGGGIALIEGSKIDVVKKIIAVSSANYGQIMKKYNSLKDLSGYQRYMKKQIMINSNIDAFLQELLDNQNEYQITNYKHLLEHKKVLIIEDNNKNEIWINELGNVNYVLLASDHNFINERLELTDLIVNFINGK